MTKGFIQGAQSVGVYFHFTIELTVVNVRFRNQSS
jgi:hypothetical protein